MVIAGIYHGDALIVHGVRADKMAWILHLDRRCGTGHKYDPVDSEPPVQFQRISISGLGFGLHGNRMARRHHNHGHVDIQRIFRRVGNERDILL